MTPPPPLQGKVTAIPPNVERVVMTALAKDPKQRFGNVQAFAKALEQASQPKQPERRPELPVSDTTDASQSQPPITLTAPPTHDWPMSEIPVSPSIQSQGLVSGSNKEGSGVVSVPLSSPSPQPAQHQVSRRIIILGLGLAGLVVTGGGITWSLLTTSNGNGYSSSGTATAVNSITGQIVSVNTQTHSVTLLVNGQQCTVSGLTDQQIAALQSQINQTYTFQVTQSGTNAYMINQNTQQQESSNSTSTPVSNQNSTPVQGNILFVGKVQSVNGNNVVVSTPDGQTLTLNIVTNQTDTSDMKGTPLSSGQVIKVKAITDQSGNFVASKVGIDQPINQQQDMSIVLYQGVTTSAVGSSNQLSFKVGNKSYSFPIGTGANLKDFNNNAQSIQNNMQVQVEVTFNGTNGTVIKISNPNS